MEMVEKKQAKGLFFALSGSNVSIPEHFLLQFAALLCLKGQSGSGTRQQSSDPDRFASFIAIAVIANVDSVDGLLDFFQQFAFAVAGAQLQGMLFFNGGAV